MRKKLYHVRLTNDQRAQLNALTTKGLVKVRTYKRACILLQADEHAGEKVPSDTQIARQVGVTVPTVHRIRQRFAGAGLEAVLSDKARAGRPLTFTGKDRATITALACADPPEGRARWTLRLLADKLVELAYVEDISHMTVQRVLKKTS